VYDVHRAFRTHDRDLRGGPGEIGVGANVLGSHHAVGAAISLARDNRNLRNCGFGKSEKQLRAMLDDPAKFLLRSGKKAGNVFKGQQRNVERIAEAHEARAFHRSVDIENPGEVGGLIADDTDGAAVEPGKTNDKIFRIVFVDLEEIAFVHDGMNHFLDVVRFLWVRRSKRVEGVIVASGRS